MEAEAEPAPFRLEELLFPAAPVAAVGCQTAFNQGLLISAKAFPRGMKGRGTVRRGGRERVH